MKSLAIIILAVWCSFLYAGEIQKWVDKDGNVHYGNVPPLESNAETVKIQRESQQQQSPASPYGSEEKRAIAKRREAWEADQAEQERLQDNVKKAEKKVRDIQSENYDPAKCKAYTAEAAMIKSRDRYYEMNIDYFSATEFMKLYCYK